VLERNDERGSTEKAADPDLSEANVRGKCQSCCRLSSVVAPDNFTSFW
jgi:hypothetical protein